MTSTHLIQTWPSLPLAEWQDTYTTLQLWLQIVGKVRLKQSPPLNHCWQSTFYVTSRGLTTSPIPYYDRTFEVHFDFIDHCLKINTSEGTSEYFHLTPMYVAEFYEQFMELLETLEIEIDIWPCPVEIPNAIPFDDDNTHFAYDPSYAHRFWQIMVHSACVFETFRSRFIGKCSPVHFFWGAFDLAVTRFSGRRAPIHPSVPNLADFVTREAYSHEVSSGGFWPGGGAIVEPFYYSYAYPEPKGFKDSKITDAFYSADFGEFVLPYEAVRQAKDPSQRLLSFLQETYEAAAQSGNWDRVNLERDLKPA
jgi:hypothetical protein